jgi:dTDP-4-dehydrorhamnose reductase
MPKPKLLVTGASGFIGSQLFKDLAPEWDAAGPRIELSAPEKAEKAVLALAPAAVVHAAAMAGPDECQLQPELAAKVNTDGAEAVARACRRLKARLVFFSTDLVFDGRSSLYKETDRPRPLSVYGGTKLAAEEAVLRECPDAAILRVASVYGIARSGRPSFLDTLLDKLSRGEAVPCFTDQWRTATPCAGLPGLVRSLLLRPDLSGVFHWAGAERASRLEFAQAVCRAFGFPESLLVPSRMADARFPAPRPRDTSLDCGKLSRLLKLRPWTLAEGLERARRDQG